MSAAANGNLVNLVGAEVRGTTGSSRSVGIAPGGTVTGIAGINGNLYAVSDAGGLYVIPSSTLATNTAGSIGTYVTGSYQLRGLQFSGLSAGPRNVANGQYSNLLFGTTVDGTIYAFNTNGELQNVFANGRSSVSTGVFGLNGLAFSNLDYNLWHETLRRANDVGHGINVPNDLSDTASAGATSWYFGFEDPRTTPRTNASFTPGTNPLTSPKALGQPVNNTYNFSGGALGVLESQPFSLSGMTVQDSPTLMFSYFMDNDDGASALNSSLMTDSFRVYGVGDDGVWQLLTTNNRDPRETAVEKTTNNVQNPASPVSPAVAWRQAVVDLGAFAGSKNVRLRFEFNTAGSMGFGTSGGKGFELRTVAGSELRDGQTFTISGQQFEIEMGFSLVVPGGAGIKTGDSIAVLGVNFVFWDGTGVQPAGNVVQFGPSDSPETIAQLLHQRLQSTVYPKPNSTVDMAEPVGGSDTIPRAVALGITGGAVRVSGVGEIGDNPAFPTALDRDIDLFKMDLEAGTTIVATASVTSPAIVLLGGSLLDPYLRLFDSSGKEIAANNDFGGALNSRISFTVGNAGRYYLGVSGSANTRYNPNVIDSGTSGGTQDKYELTVDVTPRLNFSVVDNRVTIDGAQSVTVPANSPFTLTGRSGLNNPSNIPVYVSATMTEQQVARRVAQAMEQSLGGGLDSYSTFNARDRYIDVTGLTVSNPGPFTVSTPRLEDSFSENGLATLPVATRARNNAF